MSAFLDAALRLLPIPRAPVEVDPRIPVPGESVKEKRDRWKLMQETVWIRPFDRERVEHLQLAGWELRIILYDDGKITEAGLGRFKPGMHR